MEGFRIRRKFRLRCFNIEGRDPRARFGRERKVNRRMMRSLKAFQVAASEIEELYRRTRAVIQLMSEANKLADGWIYEFLIMIENDPLMMNAFERINAQNLDVTSEEHIDQNQDDLSPFLKSIICTTFVKHC